MLSFFIHIFYHTFYIDNSINIMIVLKTFLILKDLSVQSFCLLLNRLLI